MTAEEEALSSDESSILKAAQRINAELDRRAAKPMTLSTPARSKMEMLLAEYLADLGQESIRVARRDSLSTVDESHVDRAASKIGSGLGGSASTTIFNTVGGLVSGAGFASTRALVFEPGPHGVPEVITAIGLSTVGFAFLSIGLTLTLARRGR